MSTHVPMNPREGEITNPGAGNYLSPAGKVAVIRDHLARYQCRTLIETGIYSGHGSGMECLDLLDRYIAIDYQPENIDHAREVCPTAELYVGDSGIVLRNLLTHPAACGAKPLTGTVCFWLDAHAISDDEDAPPCPLARELAIIPARHVVLIDDLRLFGMLDWPTREQIATEAARWAHEAWTDDIVRLTP